MLGHCDNPKCPTDLWAPNPEMWGHNAIENRAFSAFCLNESENEDIIARIAAGDYYVDFSDLSTLDLEYIKKELLKRHGIEIDFETA